MNFKQVLIVVFLVTLALVIPALMILSLKSDVEFLKTQTSTLQELIDSLGDGVEVLIIGGEDTRDVDIRISDSPLDSEFTIEPDTLKN